MQPATISCGRNDEQERQPRVGSASDWHCRHHGNCGGDADQRSDFRMRHRPPSVAVHPFRTSQSTLKGKTNVKDQANPSEPTSREIGVQPLVTSPSLSEAEVLEIQRHGATARVAGKGYLNSPYYRSDMMPAATGESLAMWQSKVHAWEFGWRMEDLLRSS